MDERVLSTHVDGHESPESGTSILRYAAAATLIRLLHKGSFVQQALSASKPHLAALKLAGPANEPH
jgi:hypothetical protein